MGLTKQNLATGIAATFIPVSILVGVAAGSIAKLINPDDVNVTNELAYLGWSVIPAFVTLLGLILAVIVLSLLLRRRDGSYASARLPLALLLINLLLGAGILLFREVDGAAQDNWSRANNQPTREDRNAQMDKFFKALDEQKSSKE